MWFWKLSTRTIALGLLLGGTTRADIPLSCANDDLDQSCKKPLGNVTVVTPNEHVALVRCYGCSTVGWIEEPPRKQHIITKEENALFFNISLSSSRKELLLNSVPLFPPLAPLPSRPPKIYAAQVATNFSIADLAKTIQCTTSPCKNFDGKCFCVENTVGGVSLGYDYTALPAVDAKENEGIWEINFDAIGGYNGFQDDPYEIFGVRQQQSLVVRVKQNPRDKTLEILGIQLADRQRQPDPVSNASNGRSFWQNVLLFFGLEGNEVEEPGRVLYLPYEWNSFGREGSLIAFLRALSYNVPWELILIIIASTLGGLAVLYALYRLGAFLYRLHMTERERFRRSEEHEDGAARESARLLDGADGDDDDDYRETTTLRAVRTKVSRQSRTGKPLPSKPLPEKPLPPLPLVEDL